ncbi:monocarboxylate transporter 12-like [Asterias rubens]|uniref:monocarboxylate transporter 12-like n=1 Tax=Asterias rubens TaxID=7604 RepID=UPI0014551822|nr:monocarboxylate transporter 12-like [Asterias rubens]
MGCSFLQSVSSWFVKTFKDGGLLGWFAVLGLFSSWIAWIGLIKGLAVMLPTLQEQFNASTWLVGWMIAIIDASMQISALFASPLREKLGVRVVVMVSGLLVGGSMIASAFATSLSQITVLLTLAAGPAVGCSLVVSKELVGRCFSEASTTAFGVGILGGSIAFVTCVPLTQFFLDIYGWRGTMLLLGGILSHLAVCGALMKEPAVTRIRPNDEYQTVALNEDTGDGEATSNSRCCSCFNSVHSFISQTFKLGLFSLPSFWLIIFMCNIWMMMNTAWVIYFVVYTTESKGFSLGDASNCVVSYGIGRILSSITVGPLVKNFKVRLSNSAWLGLGLFLSSLYYLIDPWLMSFWPVLVAAFIYGFFKVMIHIQFDLVVIESFGADRMGLFLGWNGLFTGVTGLFTLYFPGLIYDHFGSYTLALILMGGVQLLTVVALFVLVWLRRRSPASL